MRDKGQFDPDFEDLRRIASALEAAATKANRAILTAVAIDPDVVVEAFAATHARLLRLDKHGEKLLREAFEEKRVKTYARDNVFAAAVLTAAVALSLYKKLPRKIGGGLLDRAVERVRPLSTSGLTLSAYSMTSLYATLGAGLLKRLKASRGAKVLNSKR
jgi:hypothetical protein